MSPAVKELEAAVTPKDKSEAPIAPSVVPVTAEASTTVMTDPSA